MKYLIVLTMVASALAAPDSLSMAAPDGLAELAARSIGGRCAHSSISGTCQKTSTCGSSGGWYSNGDCPNDPAHVKCCMYTACKDSKNTLFGLCKNKASGCSGGKWYKNDCPGGDDVQCCVQS